MPHHRLFFAQVATFAMAATAAAQVVVSTDIAASTTWTSNNVYQLSGDIYVLPGATLTIQPGTVIASNAQSSLCICRGAQVFANGTFDAPIILTSTADLATWVAGNPRAGVYRQLANNEWGGLYVLGSAYVSENQIGTNTPSPNASNYADMAGLAPSNASLNDYGGGNDNDDSGSLSYCSFRYGGFSLAPGVQGKGLSLGGVGRGTAIHHIETLNALDDGIGIQGGTVDLKYVSIWNAGDDSFYVDQGWRGRAQFGLLVQGHSGSGPQGSGFGDNSFEFDGAELCSYQPVTTAAIYNFTLIGTPPFNAQGQPDPTYAGAGNAASYWSDNANVQIRNCIIMDTGDNVIEQGLGYGCAGTAAWAARWTTPWSSTSPVNPFANPAAAYTAQIDGSLIDFRDNRFFNNIRALAYAEANMRSVFTGGLGTSNANNTIVNSSPINQLVRGSLVSPNGVNRSRPVVYLDPTPTYSAPTGLGFAPANGFYTAARFQGAFPRGNDWLVGWTATSMFGLTGSSKANVYLGGERAGSVGAPVHYTLGNWAAQTPVLLAVENIEPTTNLAICVFGSTINNLPLLGGVLVPNPDAYYVVTGTNGIATLFPFVVPGGLSGTTFFTQFVNFDAGLPAGQLAFSNAQAHTLP